MELKLVERCHRCPFLANIPRQLRFVTYFWVWAESVWLLLMFVQCTSKSPEKFINTLKSTLVLQFSHTDTLCDFQGQTPIKDKNPGFLQKHVWRTKAISHLRNGRTRALAAQKENSIQVSLGLVYTSLYLRRLNSLSSIQKTFTYPAFLWRKHTHPCELWIPQHLLKLY